jgi:hypothetical protein
MKAVPPIPFIARLIRSNWFGGDKAIMHPPPPAPVSLAPKAPAFLAAEISLSNDS